MISAGRWLLVFASIFGRCVRVWGQPRAEVRVILGWRRSHAVRFVVAAGVAAVVVASGGAAARAQESGTVRVAARQLVDGGVEVALQQHSDGSWSARLLPDQRVVPAGAAAGHWWVSAPQRIDGTSARVAARRLSDGAIEFAVQVRQSDDSWGPRLLPERRWLRADATAGRWLVSSPVRFGAEVAGTSPRDGPLEEALAVARRLAPEIVAPTDCVAAPLDAPDFLPNAPRAYRSGVHRGVDYDCGEPGHHAVAALDGRVVVAVGDYDSPSAVQREAILAIAEQRRSTPPFTLLMLYGNVVVIDHGIINGAGHVVTLYAHLHSLHPEIRPGLAVQAGDTLGAIGNTGTEHDAAHNPTRGIHLHWEIHIDDEFLAAGLATADTRAVYAALLSAASSNSDRPGAAESRGE